jgi:putative peptidoglycan lipid II flippase
MSPTQAARNTVRAFLSAMNIEVRGMHQAAYLLALFALLSQLLALVRDRLLASSFGATSSLDVYYAAFRVPDLLFATVASLLSLYALMPVLARLEQEGKGSVGFLSKILLLFFVAMSVIAAGLFVLAPQLATLVAPGLNHDALVLLMRVLLLQPILLGASNILASLTQLRHRFVLYAISPLLYNIGIIFGIVALYPRLGLEGLAWGVVVGALMHLLVQVPYFYSERGGRTTVKEAAASLGEVIALSLPRTLALSMGQVSLLVLTAMASFLSAGSIAIFTFAFNLQAVPLAIIGVSYSVAAFPTLSRLHAAGERSEFLRHVEAALRHMLFWAIPATVLVIVLRAQLVRTILGVGAFDWEATRLTAAALALFVVSLCAQSVSLLLARGYYAAGRTARPLHFAFLGVLVSVLSASLLSTLFHASPIWRAFLETMLRVTDIPGTTVLMLALGYCLGALLQATVGLYFFSRDFNFSLSGLWRLAFDSFGSAVIGGAVAYAVLAAAGNYLDINTTVGIVSQGLLGGIAGLATTVGVLALLGNRELIESYGALRRRLIKEPPALEATEVA